MNASFITMTTAVTLLVSTPLFALDIEPDDVVVDEGAREVIIVEKVGVAHGDANTVEVKVDNGEVSVRLNGEEIDSDLIREKDGRIIILDGDGNEIESLRRLNIGGGHDITVQIGEQDGPIADLWFQPGMNAFRFGPEDAGPPPPVMLGITMTEPGPALRRHLRLEAGEASMVTSVLEGFPAHQAGIEQYDVIVEIEGAEKADSRSIREALMERAPGDRVRLSVIHEGRLEKTSLVVTAYDADAMREANVLGGGRANVMTFGPRGDVQKGLRWFDAGDKEGNVFVAPDGKVFEFRHEMKSGEIQERIDRHMRDALRRFREGSGDNELELQFKGEGEGDRLEEMADRMSGIERMLDQLLEELEGRREKEDR